jgi:hypothetical protein
VQNTNLFIVISFFKQVLFHSNILGVFLTAIYFKLSNTRGSSILIFLFLANGLAGGNETVLFFLRKFNFGKKDSTEIISNAVLQSIERVFKVVTAEGHFSEIYNYSNTSTILSQIAQKQMKILSLEMTNLKQFQVEGSEKIRIPILFFHIVLTHVFLLHALNLLQYSRG